MRGFGGLRLFLRHVPLTDKRLIDPGLPGPNRGVALFLTIDTINRKKQRLEPLQQDLLSALSADSVSIVLKTIESKVDRFEPIFHPFDKAGMGLYIGHRTRNVHLVAGRRRRLLLLVMPVFAHARQRLVALVGKNRTQRLLPLMIVGLSA